MARIRILELPSKVIGEYMDSPFSIVIDQVEIQRSTSSSGELVEAELSQPEADLIARAMGAVSAILVTCTLDVV